MNIIKKLFNYLCSLFSKKRFRTVYVDDMPEDYKKKSIYIVGEDNPWYAIMLCPCGCNEIIRLCLQDEVSPSWKLKFHSRNESVSLYPSVWRTSGCRSHFFFIRGRIEWCK